MTLDQADRNITLRVASVDPEGAHSWRLMEMGIVPGAPIRVVKSAPFGDPIQVCVRDYHLALRRSDARSISVGLDGDYPRT